MFVKVLADNAYSQCRRARVVMVDYLSDILPYKCFFFAGAKFPGFLPNWCIYF